MAQHSPVLPAYVANWTPESRTLIPQWLLPIFQQMNSRPDATCILPAGTKDGHQRDIQVTHPSRWDVHLTSYVIDSITVLY